LSFIRSDDEWGLTFDGGSIDRFYNINDIIDRPMWEIGVNMREFSHALGNDTSLTCDG